MSENRHYRTPNNTGGRKKNACFSNNCNFVFSIWKNYVNTKTTCNKCSFLLLTL